MTDSPPSIGAHAPAFNLRSIRDQPISLKSYLGSQNVILWFSRGFTCNFCRGYMQNIIEGYGTLRASDTEILQVAPNLERTAKRYFGAEPPPYPFLCDPDKRLYAIYGLGDRGVLEATRNTLISFSTAFANGDGPETVRASWIDVANRNFVRRLHHHALTAMEQGLFLIDKEGVIRYQSTLSAIDAVPSAEELRSLVQALCET